MTNYSVRNYEIVEHQLGGYTYFTVELIKGYRVEITEVA